MTIKGNLILGDAIGEGEVHLNGMTVEGTTKINGGGVNSIFFTDSVLATVIVNKNTGAVRIVAQGGTEVYEVQLETPARVVETNLDAGASGFNDITVTEAMQTSNFGVQLEGVFETINSRATNVRINLSEGTDIRTLILNAIAEVLGTGNIQLAEINASGSTLSQRPQNVVLNNGQVTIGGVIVDSSYSDENATATLNSINANQGSISVNTTSFIAGLQASDFEVTAKLDGVAIELQNVNYNSNQNRFTFNPIAITGNNGKTVEITVVPAEGSKVMGEAKTASFAIETGFAGRITDIQGVGMANATIKFRENTGIGEGQVVGEATTDRYGYYSVNLPTGTYKGEISGPGYVISNMFGVAATDVFLTDQNETGIRAAASNEVKIMLDWGEYPQDLDSHLVGPGVDGSPFHIWFANRQTGKDGITYVDLDWDDTDSYGPETTTIRKLVDGEYRFYIHNWSGNYQSTLASSGAKVKVFKGNASTPDYTFSVPTGDGSDRYWVVFEMNVSDNGETVEVQAIDKMVDVETPTWIINGDAQNSSSLVPVGSTIELTASEGAKIHYTTDGSQATIDSPIYEGPIVINERMYINTIVVNEGIIVGQDGKYFELTSTTTTSDFTSVDVNTSSDTVTLTFTEGVTIATGDVAEIRVGGTVATADSVEINAGRLEIKLADSTLVSNTVVISIVLRKGEADEETYAVRFDIDQNKWIVEKAA